MAKSDKQFDVSRRNALRKGAVAAASLVAGGVLLKSPGAHAAKASQAAMMYQDKPHGDQDCAGCVQFIPGATADANGTCKVVAGSISPHGWCVAFTPKS